MPTFDYFLLDWFILSQRSIFQIGNSFFVVMPTFDFFYAQVHSFSALYYKLAVDFCIDAHLWLFLDEQVHSFSALCNKLAVDFCIDAHIW